MVKSNSFRSRPQGKRKSFQYRPSKFLPKGKGKSQRKPAMETKKKSSYQAKSQDQLDKELELYWGNEIGSKHLDQEMDDYWKNKKPVTED